MLPDEDDKLASSDVQLSVSRDALLHFFITKFEAITTVRVITICHVELVKDLSKVVLRFALPGNLPLKPCQSLVE